MGAIIEVITGRATNPAALAALTMNTGDTATVRSYGPGANPMLHNVWTEQATAGTVRVRSPRLHDSTQGIHLEAPASTSEALLPFGSEQRLYQTDTLTLEIQGGGAEVDAAAFLMYYDNPDSGAGKYAMWEQVKPLVNNILTVRVTVTDPTTSGDWSAGNLLNSLTDLLKADTYYALLGYETAGLCTAIAVRGPDTGNYRVGGPGRTNPKETRDWFKKLSLMHGRPYIPILNSQNDGATDVFTARVTTGGTVNVGLIMAELSASAG